MADRRDRMTITLNEELAKVLPPRANRRARSDFVHEALRGHVWPDIRYIGPQEDDEAKTELREFVKQTEQQLWMVGMAFQFTVGACGDVLEDLVQNGVALNVVLLRAERKRGEALYPALRQRLGSERQADDMLKQVRQATAFFKSLRALGEASGAAVRLHSCDELPMVGLLLRDADLATRRMRVSLYTSIEPRVRHPHLEITPRTHIGDSAYQAYHSYLLNLMTRTEPIPP